MKKPVRTLIVDDSIVVRMVLNEILSQDPDIEVVATAEDPFDAREKIKKYDPDVVTLDIEMPKMDGISFLKRIMRLRPVPVIMVSTLTAQGADITLQALEIGAVDFVHKPGQQEQHIKTLGEELIAKVKMAATANLASRELQSPAKPYVASTRKEHYSVVAIGASTGGTEAIKEALMDYPKNGPPVIISQHIPPIFSTTYCQRLSQTVGVPVIEVMDKVALESGTIYLAHGDSHMIFRKSSQVFALADNSEKVNKHRPSVDVMFNSISTLYGDSILGVLLTGMGADGAEGLLKIRQNGAHTVAQDESSSVVYGMPRRAAELGAAVEVLSLQDIRQKLANICLKN
ncbi:MAG TPA: chemotaxis response regulator protein-glutamate methylesterase [Aeromonadales bacterium]|nr:chemotaxis response regulator protein-glutamate methylesterase [Aeromonadales bacterium]